MHEKCVNEVDVNPFNFQTSEQMQKKREVRSRSLKQMHGITVIDVWECDILKEANTNSKLHNLIKFASNTYLRPRSAFMGGRVDVFQRHYKCNIDEVIRIADVVR